MIPDHHSSNSRAGLLYGLAAHGLWGLMPLYFVALGTISSFELFAHRIVWCFALLFGIVTATGGWPQLFRRLRNGPTAVLLALSGVLIGVNWFLFIYGVESKQVTEASLGYFINPLFNVLLGLVIFHERLRPAQWLAVAIAAAGIVYLIAVTGQIPWLALALAGSFGLYGLLRKITVVDGIQGLLVETVLWLPLGVSLVAYWTMTGQGVFLTKDRTFDALLLASGVVTAVPLFCFGQAARRLSMTTLGFLQYLAPTLQFLLAYYYLNEKQNFGPERLAGFVCVWLALGIFSIDSLIAVRRSRTPQPTGSVS